MRSGLDARCRICSGGNMDVFLDLGDQPWCNDFVTANHLGREAKYPLEICFCHDCSAVQVPYTVPKEIMYNDHPYLSGVNTVMCRHFNDVALNVCNKYMEFSSELVVDIGSNDGTLLKPFKDAGMRVLGIEPCNTAAKVAIDNGIDTITEFFNFESSQRIASDFGKAKIISAANVFYHVEELHSIVDGIKHLLSDDGVFVMQGSYLPSIMKKKAFDIMYHEHLLYYRMKTLQHILNIHGLEVFDVEDSTVHGGSVIAYICHKNSRTIKESVTKLEKQEEYEGFDRFDKYLDFGQSIVNLKEDIIEIISRLRKNGHSIYAFGAPAKGTVLLNYCNLKPDLIELAVEKNPLKFGHFVPGVGTPIVDENEVNEPDYYLVLSWNFINEFCKSEKFTSGKRKFIVPLPEPKILKK